MNRIIVICNIVKCGIIYLYMIIMKRSILLTVKAKDKFVLHLANMVLYLILFIISKRSGCLVIISLKIIGFSRTRVAVAIVYISIASICKQCLNVAV